MTPPDPVRPYQGRWPQIGERVFIDPSAVVIGAVVLEDDVSVWPTAVIRGDVEHIAIGAASNIQDGAVLHVTHDGPFSPGGRALDIGKQVTVGHRATLHACSVGDRCLIGIGAIVLDDAEICADVLIAAGCLVPPRKRLESGFLYAGSPARRIRELSGREIEQLRYSAEHYVRIKDSYRAAENAP